MQTRVKDCEDPDEFNLAAAWTYFKDQCDYVCPDPEMQCNCLVDIAYEKPSVSKTALWKLCGKQMVKNLLSKNGNKISYPVETESEFSDFAYSGRWYSMVTSEVSL